MMLENDPLIGLQLGAYQIQSKLGEGGMARVYKGYHARLRRDVAIKVILPEVAEQAGFRERFEREAQVVANLEHPHIVSVYDYGDQSLPDLGLLTFLVMQYVGGGTLREQMHGRRFLDTRLAATYARDMASALHHAHQRGIIHRDVKPQNMLITTGSNREILLSDFGIAKLFDQQIQDLTYTTQGPSASYLDELTQIKHNPQLTSVGQLVGTAEYMAPEQINQQPVDARTDVYALGVVLFQMLTGQVPFQSSSLLGLLYQHVNTVAPDVRELNPTVPESLAQITARAMAKNPQQRFPSAEAMATALNAIIPPSIEELNASFSSSYTTNQGMLDDRTAPSQRSQPSYTTAGANTSTPGYPGMQMQGPVSSPGVTRQTMISGAGTNARSLTGQVGVSQRKSSRKAFSVGSVALTIVIVLAVVIALIAQGRFPGLTSATNTNTGNTTGTNQVIQAFNDNFQDNHLQWTQQAPNLTTSLGNGQYAITVANTNPNTYYFPYPAVVGTLPADFTWSAQIGRSKGSVQNLYGLVFHLTQQGNFVSCYALVIDGAGHYTFWKFNASAANPGTPLQLVNGAYTPAQSGAQGDRFQIKVHNQTFSASINNKTISFNDPTHQSYTDHAAYTGGLPGFLVTGPNANFSISSAQLTLS